MWVYLAGESVRCTWQAGKCDTGQKALASKLLPGEYHKLVTCVNGGTSATLEPHAFQAGSEGERGWEREFLKQKFFVTEKMLFTHNVGLEFGVRCSTRGGWQENRLGEDGWLVGWLVG